MQKVILTNDIYGIVEMKGEDGMALLSDFLARNNHLQPGDYTYEIVDITEEVKKDKLRYLRKQLLTQVDYEINTLEDDTAINGTDNSVLLLKKRQYRQYLRDITIINPLPQTVQTFVEWDI